MSGCWCCSGLRSELADTCSSMYDDGVTIEMSREGGPWEIAATGYDDGGYICGFASVEIAYCPMCGRRLDKEDSDD